MNVRVTLTDAGTAQLAQLLGGGTASLKGRVTAVTDSTIALATSSVTRLSGTDETWNGEPVVLPRQDIASVSAEHVSVARSLLAAGALIGGAYAVTRAGAGSGVAGGGRTPPPTGH